jgi:hypothetical protein
MPLPEQADACMPGSAWTALREGGRVKTPQAMRAVHEKRSLDPESEGVRTATAAHAPQTPMTRCATPVFSASGMTGHGSRFAGSLLQAVHQLAGDR